MSSARTFLALTLTQALSLIGSRMTGLAIGFWIYAQTGNVTPILLTAFFLELPGILVGGLAGVLADRWDRRHAIILGDAGEAAGTLLLLLSFLSGGFQLWHLYTAALIKGIFMAIQQPAASAAITMLVPDAQRNRANAIKELAFPLAGVLAPVLAGLLYPLIDVTGIILLDIATFGQAVLVVLLLHIPHPRPTQEGWSARGGFWSEFLGSLRFLRSRPSLLWLMGYIALTNFLLNGPLELTLPYLSVLTGKESTVGVIMGVMSAGALAGALTMAVWGGTRRRMLTLLPAMLLAGGMMVLYGLVRAPVLLSLALFGVLFPLPMTNAVVASTFQSKTPPDMQGRIFAVVYQIIFITAPVSFLITGPLVDNAIEPMVASRGWAYVEPLVGAQPGSGMALVLLAAGLLIVAGTLAAAAVPALRRLDELLPDYPAVEKTPDEPAAIPIDAGSAG